MDADRFELEAVAEGLWLRMRDVILAERRLEGFTFAPETPEVGAMPRLSALAADPRAVSDLARDVALRALAAASDGVNFRVLSELRGRPPGAPPAAVTLDELASRVGLPPLALAERLSALAQVGLAVRDVERKSAAATAAGEGLVSLVETLGGALGHRLSRGLPALLGS